MKGMSDKIDNLMPILWILSGLFLLIMGLFDGEDYGNTTLWGLIHCAIGILMMEIRESRIQGLSIFLAKGAEDADDDGSQEQGNYKH